MVMSFLVLAAMAQTAPPRVETYTGTFKAHTIESKRLATPRRVQIWLPPNYGSSEARFPVVYLLDGQNCFSGHESYIPNQEWRADESADGLIRAGLLRPVILVAVDNGGVERANEYLPFSVTMTRGTDKSTFGGQAENFSQFLIQDVKAMIDKNYRTLPEARHTAIVGSSFGGIMALHLGLNHGKTFGNIIAMSPSLWTNDGETIRRYETSFKPNGTRFWIDMGSGEGEPLIAATRKLGDTIRAKGVRSPQNLVVYIENNAGHNENAWAGRLPSALQWLWGRG